MNKLVFIIFLFSVIIVKSQKISVVDSLDKSSISYSEILIDGNRFFTDSLGNFNLSGAYKNIIIKKPGYYDKTLKKIENLVKLSPKVISIPEVHLTKRERKYISAKTKNNSTTVIPLGLEYGFKISNPYNKDGIIKSLMVPIKKIYENKAAILVIKFYSISNEVIENEPIENSSIIININKLNKKENSIDFTDNFVMIPKEGLFISIQVIEEFGSDKIKIDKPSISFINSVQKGKIYFLDVYERKWKLLSNNTALIGLSLIGDF